MGADGRGGRGGGGTTNDARRRRRETDDDNRRRRRPEKPQSHKATAEPETRKPAPPPAPTRRGGDRKAAHKTIKSSQKCARGPRMSKAAIQEGRLQAHRGEYRKTRKRARKRGIRGRARLFNRGRQSRSGRLDGGSREVVRLTRPPKNGPGLGRPDDDAEALE